MTAAATSLPALSPVQESERLHAALTRRVLRGGVPGNYSVLNLTFALVVSLSFHLPQVGIPVGLLIHGFAARLFKTDEFFLEVAIAAQRKPNYLDV